MSKEGKPSPLFGKVVIIWALSIAFAVTCVGDVVKKAKSLKRKKGKRDNHNDISRV